MSEVGWAGDGYGVTTDRVIRRGMVRHVRCTRQGTGTLIGESRADPTGAAVDPAPGLT
jgi:hypothetical protein